MPRYVVLRHELPLDSERPSHWDFMLESGEVLRTWALLQRPDTSEPQIAEALVDHRLAYLEYEGPVSGDRGCVVRWDAGIYEPLNETEISQPSLAIRVAGDRLRGDVKLLSAADAWRFVYSADSSD
ncbi:MAG: hypothetical protein C0483_05815 [Pirellula sp.]|nr:hypothetical protein [Pirellula sp.]